MLRSGIVGIRGSLIMRLRPRMIVSTHTPTSPRQHSGPVMVHAIILDPGFGAVKTDSRITRATRDRGAIELRTCPSVTGTAGKERERERERERESAREREREIVEQWGAGVPVTRVHEVVVSSTAAPAGRRTGKWGLYFDRAWCRRLLLSGYGFACTTVWFHGGGCPL